MEVSLFSLAAGLILYVLAGRLTMRRLDGRAREIAGALLNTAAVFYFVVYIHNFHAGPIFAFYVLIVVFQYVLFRLFSDARGWLPWLAFFTPIAVLIVIRYIPAEVFIALGHKLGKTFRGPPSLVGISYLTFRCSRLVLEVRNGSVKKPGFWEYLGFAFFLPTMLVGPINTYANYRRGFEAVPWEVPAGRALMRIMVGLVKYQILGGFLGPLTYSTFLLNGHLHYWIDLPIVMVIYYVYLYCNFSGFCDMAIGAAALIGIPVQENFNNPMAARNMKDLWNRWHITLSQWMRDLVFVPLSKSLVRWMGPHMANHAIAITIGVVFLLVGIWHGTGWNFVFFGAVQALGVVTVHYYTIGLKKRLGREGFKAYNENRWIQAAAVTATFAYFSATTLFFANTVPQIKEIFQSLR